MRTRRRTVEYLRNTYVKTTLSSRGKVCLMGEALDLGSITLDVYAVGAEKDHIVPSGTRPGGLGQVTGSSVQVAILASEWPYRRHYQSTRRQGRCLLDDHGGRTCCGSPPHSGARTRSARKAVVWN